jgi:hypothetical protein
MTHKAKDVWVVVRDGDIQNCQHDLVLIPAVSGVWKEHRVCRHCNQAERRADASPAALLTSSERLLKKLRHEIVGGDAPHDLMRQAADEIERAHRIMKRAISWLQIKEVAHATAKGRAIIEEMQGFGVGSRDEPKMCLFEHTAILANPNTLRISIGFQERSDYENALKLFNMEDSSHQETTPKCKTPDGECAEPRWCGEEGACLYPKWHPEAFAKAENERLQRIGALMDAQPGTPEGQELDALVDEQVKAEGDQNGTPNA